MLKGWPESALEIIYRLSVKDRNSSSAIPECSSRKQAAAGMATIGEGQGT